MQLVSMQGNLLHISYNYTELLPFRISKTFNHCAEFSLNPIKMCNVCACVCRCVSSFLLSKSKNQFFTITASGTTNQQSQQPPQAAQPQTTSSSSTSTATTSQAAPKRKRSVNPQSDENFQRALEAVRYGGIGFCKAARMYGCNNRTLWLEYKKRGYPISRPSIKNRIKLEPNMTPPPTSPTPTNEENTSMENYEHNMTPAQQSTINMSTVPPPAETPTSIMCPPHAHPAMGVMSFLDTSRTTHVSFEPHPTTLQRQRYPDGVNVNPTAINLQGLNFNSM